MVDWEVGKLCYVHHSRSLLGTDPMVCLILSGWVPKEPNISKAQVFVMFTHMFIAGTLLEFTKSNEKMTYFQFFVKTPDSNDYILCSTI